MKYCDITLQWPGGEHQFSLDWAQLRALESIADIGPLALLQSIQTGNWKLDDLLNTIRLGLIGAGMDTVEAKRAVSAAAELHPPAAFVQTAILALAAGVMGLGATTENDGGEDGGNSEHA